MFFQVTGAFAEFERAMIVTRVRQGLARVKATGRTKSGRPIGRPKVPFATERAIKERLAAGVGQARIARELRCGVGTVRRVALGATR
jgi:DNA invertase Pin-like site-specific DNA recombinase